MVHDVSVMKCIFFFSFSVQAVCKARKFEWEPKDRFGLNRRCPQIRNVCLLVMFHKKLHAGVELTIDLVHEIHRTSKRQYSTDGRNFFGPSCCVNAMDLSTPRCRKSSSKNHPHALDQIPRTEIPHFFFPGSSPVVF